MPTSLKEEISICTKMLTALLNPDTHTPTSTFVPDLIIILQGNWCASLGLVEF